MDFAKKQLEKYGWTEGKGLGKSEDGIQTALKPKPKHGSSGLGHDIAEEFTNHWWQKVYNNASSNIEVKIKDNGEVDSFATKYDDAFEINTKRNSKTKKRKAAELNERRKKILYTENFVQRATLTNGVEDTNKMCSDSDSDCDDDLTKKIEVKKLTDEELFAACGSRTAHKGARHGLKSNGKLQRINNHEDELLEILKVNYNKKTCVQSPGNKRNDSDGQSSDITKQNKKTTVDGDIKIDEPVNNITHDKEEDCDFKVTNERINKTSKKKEKKNIKVKL